MLQISEIDWIDEMDKFWVGLAAVAIHNNRIPE